MSNQVSKFHGIRIVHPHSGKVSASVVSRILRNRIGNPKNHTDKEVADFLLQSCDTIFLKDVNNEIRFDGDSWTQ